jgi:Lrp/AsnC family leucine-responsive transcriptional regulator
MKDTAPIILDDADNKILRQLAQDARASDLAIGERINLSSSSVARRRKALEDSGIILGYDVRLDLAKLGLSGVVVVSIELTSQSVEALDEFEREVIARPSISYCGFVSGENDFVILIHVGSFNDYDTIYRHELSSLPHVAKIKSSFVLRQVARRANPPIILQN